MSKLLSYSSSGCWTGLDPNPLPHGLSLQVTGSLKRSFDLFGHHQFWAICKTSNSRKRGESTNYHFLTRLQITFVVEKKPLLFAICWILELLVCCPIFWTYQSNTNSELIPLSIITEITLTFHNWITVFENHSSVVTPIFSDLNSAFSIFFSPKTQSSWAFLPISLSSGSGATLISEVVFGIWIIKFSFQAPFTN